MLFDFFMLVEFSSVAQLCPTPWDPMDCNTQCFPVHHQLGKLTQTHVHRVNDAIQPSHPSVVSFSSCLQSFAASGSFQMRQLFTSVGQSIGVAASVLPSSEYSGLISFRIDGFDLLAVQGTLKSLLQHHNLKHQFFGAQPFLQVILHLHSYKYSRKKIISIKKRWKVS